MIIVKWVPITETEWIPPFGEELRCHLEDYKGMVKYASCSAWRLLYNILLDNNLGRGTVVFEKNGKPQFSDISIYFSLSHSRDICAVAVSDQPVGVDVEQCREKHNNHLIERSLTEDEMRFFDGDFTRIWSRKEALAKMTGQGIMGYPNDIDTMAYDFYEQRIEYNQREYWLIATNAFQVKHILDEIPK